MPLNKADALFLNSIFNLSHNCVFHFSRVIFTRHCFVIHLVLVYMQWNFGPFFNILDCTGILVNVSLQYSYTYFFPKDTVWKSLKRIFEPVLIDKRQLDISRTYLYWFNSWTWVYIQLAFIYTTHYFIREWLRCGLLN